MIIVVMAVAGSGKITIGTILAEAMKCRFMKADMLASHFDALDEPADALAVDVSATPSAIVEHLLSHMRRLPDAGIVGAQE
jgi:gluconate kinase